MSKRPTGTPMVEDRLFELHRETDAAESAFIVDVAPLLERIALSADALVDWDVDETDDVPSLVFGSIPESEEADAVYPRRLRTAGDSVIAPVPKSLLATDPPDGLGLDLEAYDDDDPLLFEAVGSDDVLGLIPARFGDGTPYRREPLPDVGGDSDPIARAAIEGDQFAGSPEPRPETVDAPIDADLLEETVADADASFGDAIDVLETIERRGLVGEGDTAPGWPPLSIGDRAVCVVSPDTWNEELVPRLETGRDALETVKRIHERQARRLADEAGAIDYRGLEDEYDLLVSGERDTAEWEVAEAGEDRWR